MTNNNTNRYKRSVEALVEWVEAGNNPNDLTKNVETFKDGKRIQFGDDIHDLLLESSKRIGIGPLKEIVKGYGITTFGIQQSTIAENRKRFSSPNGVEVSISQREGWDHIDCAHLRPGRIVQENNTINARSSAEGRTQ